MLSTTPTTCPTAPAWVIKGPANNGVGYTTFDCSDTVVFNFNGQFIIAADNSLSVTGDMVITSSLCPLLAYKTVNLTHVTLFADDKSALFQGYGIYVPLAYLGPVPFESYFITSSQGGGISAGATFWIRIWDNSGVVLFDTYPCQPTATNITVQPPSPVSVIQPNSYLIISNPTGQTISALTGEQAGTSSNIPVGIIVGVAVGIAVFVVIVALVVYFLLKTGKEQQSTATESFVQM